MPYQFDELRIGNGNQVVGHQAKLALADGEELAGACEGLFVNADHTRHPGAHLVS